MVFLKNAIHDAYKKIEREESLIMGAKSMVASTKNPEVKKRLETNIAVSENNITYLQERIQSLKLDQNGKDDASTEETDSLQKYPSKQQDGKKQLLHESRSAFEVLSSEKPLTPQKISTMLQHLQMRLSVEQQCVSGIEKILHLYSKEKKDTRDVSVKLREGKQKINLLKRSLKRYNELHIPLNQPIAGQDDHPFQIAFRGLAKPVSGRLQVTIHSVRNLEHTSFLQHNLSPTFSYAVCYVDDTHVARSRSSPGDQWDETFTFDVHRAKEIQLTIYDQKKESDVPIGFLLVPASLIAEELRRKRNLHEMSEANWKPSLADQNAYNNTSARPTTAASTASFRNSLYDPLASSPTSAPSSYTLLSRTWLSLEPVGQICVSMSFSKKLTKRQFLETGLGRQGAIRQKKDEVVAGHLGHQFIQKQFYQIMRCAVCGELFSYSPGLQCENCSFVCHKKCLHKILAGCIALSNAEKADFGRLKYQIPHRFEPLSSLGAHWCAHCGFFLPLRRKDCFRCEECNLTCHGQCAHLVPDFCGMSNDLKNQLLAGLDVNNKLSREKQGVSKQDTRSSNEHLPTISQGLMAATKPVTTILNASPVTTPDEPFKETKGMSAPSPCHLTPTPPSSTSTTAESTGKLSPSPRREKKKRITLDDFTFIAVLGKGNFGKVMLAEYKPTKKHYAIKVLKKEFILKNEELESLRTEKHVFDVANREKHPFLLNMFASFQTSTRVYFVMEYIQGGDLMVHVQRQQFSVKRARFYGAEVCLALKYFHENGIAYRDLKLDNILLCSNGHIKIADYGLCKENMSPGNTTSTFCGTPEFMAPEILLEQQYTKNVDWWAFGVLMYQMLLGQSPFKGEDEEEIFDAILTDEPLFPINMPADAVSLLRGLLTRDPEKRLGSGPTDALEVMNHPFFATIIWSDLYYLKYDPVYKPVASDIHDLNNFDEEFTSAAPNLTPVNTVLTRQQQECFRGFSSMADVDA
ncbi:AGC/PKC protein kinase Pck1 [Schizosaccharomyces cryophilus OY26]|uniref:protein kinase C n=1 Tax=Schizosaccharomyces cryophilus (strain OY26 / ATCC MYA-4695 / CBS 11777 / NBRC 106824 / NRRL Y48691) TaxID=653667 RepID=S9X476_SCHCR|nr:AGC/PKC protein kinase Pck1 [Schizosaccharomyces cryophilus OY26]EPY51852.1 AGC/PKC protein kinase Pck1 [Schizosaccharomyces cryophilus OY26]